MRSLSLFLLFSCSPYIIVYFSISINWTSVAFTFLSVSLIFIVHRLVIAS